jgi:hypothetical protein
METAMNDKAAAFVRRFRVGENTVIMTMSRCQFRRAGIANPAHGRDLTDAWVDLHLSLAN